MIEQEKRAAIEARRQRLQRLTENLDRGPDSQFYGADFQLGFNFMFGELVVLQREFNERFGVDMQNDPRFAQFYDRIIQIMESSEGVLINSVGRTLAKLNEGKKAKEKMGETPKSKNSV